MHRTAMYGLGIQSVFYLNLIELFARVSLARSLSGIWRKN